MRSRLSSSCAFVFHRSGLRCGLHLICPLLTSPRYSAPIARHPASQLRSIEKISRGKTRYLRRIDAGFTKCTPTTADGGLRASRARSPQMHQPCRPRRRHRRRLFTSHAQSAGTVRARAQPHIRFLFIAPQFRIELPSDPASRRRPCPSPCLRDRKSVV